MRSLRIAHNDRQWGRLETRPADPLPVPVLTRGLTFALITAIVAVVVLSRAPQSEIAASCDDVGGTVRAPAVHPDGTMVSAWTVDGSLTLWEPGSGLFSKLAVGDEALRNTIAMAADGSALVIEYPDRSLSIRDGQTRLPRQTIHGSKVPRRRALAFHGDAGLVASADDEGVDLWHAATGRRLGRRLDLRGATSLAISPDGRTLAIGDDRGIVRIWDPAGGRYLQEFPAHLSLVWSLAFADDGGTLASVGEFDSIVRIWDPATGRPIADLDGRTQCQFLAFSPGGRTVATAGVDGAMRLWDAATGRAFQVVTARRGAVTSLAFSPDARGVVGGGSGSIWWHPVAVTPGR